MRTLKVILCSLLIATQAPLTNAAINIAAIKDLLKNPHKLLYRKKKKSVDLKKSPKNTTPQLGSTVIKRSASLGQKRALSNTELGAILDSNTTSLLSAYSDVITALTNTPPDLTDFGTTIIPSSQYGPQTLLQICLIEGSISARNIAKKMAGIFTGSKTKALAMAIGSNNNAVLAALTDILNYPYFQTLEDAAQQAINALINAKNAKALKGVDNTDTLQFLAQTPIQTFAYGTLTLPQLCTIVGPDANDLLAQLFVSSKDGSDKSIALLSKALMSDNTKDALYAINNLFKNAQTFIFGTTTPIQIASIQGGFIPANFSNQDIQIKNLVIAAINQAIENVNPKPSVLQDLATTPIIAAIGAPTLLQICADVGLNGNAIALLINSSFSFQDGTISNLADALTNTSETTPGTAALGILSSIYNLTDYTAPRNATAVVVAMNQAINALGKTLPNPDVLQYLASNNLTKGPRLLDVCKQVGSLGKDIVAILTSTLLADEISWLTEDLQEVNDTSGNGYNDYSYYASGYNQLPGILSYILENYDDATVINALHTAIDNKGNHITPSNDVLQYLANNYIYYSDNQKQVYLADICTNIGSSADDIALMLTTAKLSDTIANLTTSLTMADTPTPNTSSVVTILQSISDYNDLIFALSQAIKECNPSPSSRLLNALANEKIGQQVGISTLFEMCSAILIKAQTPGQTNNPAWLASIATKLVTIFANAIADVATTKLSAKPSVAEISAYLSTIFNAYNYSSPQLAAQQVIEALRTPNISIDLLPQLSIKINNQQTISLSQICALAGTDGDAIETLLAQTLLNTQTALLIDMLNPKNPSGKNLPSALYPFLATCPTLKQASMYSVAALNAAIAPLKRSNIQVNIDDLTQLATTPIIQAAKVDATISLIIQGQFYATLPLMCAIAGPSARDLAAAIAAAYLKNIQNFVTPTDSTSLLRLISQILDSNGISLKDAENNVITLLNQWISRDRNAAESVITSIATNKTTSVPSYVGMLGGYQAFDIITGYQPLNTITGNLLDQVQFTATPLNGGIAINQPGSYIQSLLYGPITLSQICADVGRAATNIGRIIDTALLPQYLEDETQIDAVVRTLQEIIDSNSVSLTSAASDVVKELTDEMITSSDITILQALTTAKIKTSLYGVLTFPQICTLAKSPEILELIKNKINESSKQSLNANIVNAQLSDSEKITTTFGFMATIMDAAQTKKDAASQITTNVQFALTYANATISDSVLQALATKPIISKVYGQQYLINLFYERSRGSAATDLATLLGDALLRADTSNLTQNLTDGTQSQAVIDGLRTILDSSDYTTLTDAAIATVVTLNAALNYLAAQTPAQVPSSIVLQALRTTPIPSTNYGPQTMTNLCFLAGTIGKRTNTMLSGDDFSDDNTTLLKAELVDPLGINDLVTTLANILDANPTSLSAASTDVVAAVNTAITALGATDPNTIIMAALATENIPSVLYQGNTLLDICTIVGSSSAQTLANSIMAALLSVNEANLAADLLGTNGDNVIKTLSEILDADQSVPGVSPTEATLEKAATAIVDQLHNAIHTLATTGATPSDAVLQDLATKSITSKTYGHQTLSHLCVLVGTTANDIGEMMAVSLLKLDDNAAAITKFISGIFNEEKILANTKGIGSVVKCLQNYNVFGANNPTNANPNTLKALANGVIQSKFGPQTILHMLSLQDMTDSDSNVAGTIGLDLINLVSNSDYINLLTQQNVSGTSVIHYAALLTKSNFLSMLLARAKTIDLNSVATLLQQANLLGCTPMHYLASNPNIIIDSSLLTDLDANTRLAMLTATNSGDATPLHLATLFNHPLIISDGFFKDIPTPIAGITSPNRNGLSALDISKIFAIGGTNTTLTFFLPYISSEAQTAALQSIANAAPGFLVAFASILSLGTLKDRGGLLSELSLISKNNSLSREATRATTLPATLTSLSQSTLNILSLPKSAGLLGGALNSPAIQDLVASGINKAKSLYDLSMNITKVLGSTFADLYVVMGVSGSGLNDTLENILKLNDLTTIFNNVTGY